MSPLDLDAIRRWNDSGAILRGDVDRLIVEVERLRNENERLQAALDSCSGDLYMARAEQ